LATAVAIAVIGAGLAGNAAVASAAPTSRGRRAAARVATADTASVAYQIDAAHDGAQQDPQFALPLRKKWAHTFEGNVGYSTPEHREAIIRHGICPLHRRSFASVAYSQLGLGGDDLLPGEADDLPPDADLDSEGIADVIDIRAAIRAEADPDDVEAIARDA
jgi:hypothetical protein